VDAITVWDAVLAAFVDIHNDPNRGAGGMIGKVSTVCSHLGLDPDLLLVDLHGAVRTL